MDLTEFASVQRWLTKLKKKSGSLNTRRAYLRALKEFCEYAGMNPDELIAERQRDSKSNDMFIQRRAEDRLDKWFGKLESKDLSRNSCVLPYSAVRSFHKSNYSKLEPEDPPATWPQKSKPPLRREDLRAMIDCSKLPMHTAYILCQVQSGLSISDLLKLTGEATKDELEPDYIHLRLLRGKEKQLGFFDTFWGRMATQALKEWLSTRKELKSDARLFPCSARNINKFLERLSRKARVPFTVSSHDLRTWFSTNLKMGRVNDPAFNESLVEYWMGHLGQLGKTKMAYMAPPVDEQLRLYKMAEERLEP